MCNIETPRTKFSAIAISKSRILILGGKQSDGQRTSEIEEYNVKSDTFKVLPFRLQKARSGFATCARDSKIYFCGGNGGGSHSGGNILKRFDCLDLKKGKWSKLVDMNVQRDELNVTLGPDGCVYAIGGFGGVNCEMQDSACCLNSAEKYDFDKDCWTVLPSMTDARRALAVVAMPDGIYAIGGYDG